MKQIGITEKRRIKQYLNELLLEEIKELIEDSPYRLSYREMSAALECDGGLLIRLITKDLKNANNSKPKKKNNKFDISK